MKLLLDTSVLLWWLFDEPLDERAKAVIASPEAEVHVSTVAVWEAEIKRAIGKLEPPEDLPRAVREHGFEELPITFDHGVAAGRLPPLHGDPFDRMLVAQAQVEGLSLITADPQIARYNVHVVLAR